MISSSYIWVTTASKTACNPNWVHLQGVLPGDRVRGSQFLYIDHRLTKWAGPVSHDRRHKALSNEGPDSPEVPGLFRSLRVRQHGYHPQHVGAHRRGHLLGLSSVVYQHAEVAVHGRYDA